VNFGGPSTAYNFLKRNLEKMLNYLEVTMTLSARIILVFSSISQLLCNHLTNLEYKGKSSDRDW